MYKVDSKILGEQVIFLDKHDNIGNINNPNNLVVYRYLELQAIKGLKDPEFLKLVHSIKKEFDGIIQKREGSYEEDRRICDRNGQEPLNEKQCSTTKLSRPAKLVSSGGNCFEFFDDYRKFKERIGGAKE